MVPLGTIFCYCIWKNKIFACMVFQFAISIGVSLKMSREKEDVAKEKNFFGNFTNF